MQLLVEREEGRPLAPSCDGLELALPREDRLEVADVRVGGLAGVRDGGALEGGAHEPRLLDLARSIFETIVPLCA